MSHAPTSRPVRPPAKPTADEVAEQLRDRTTELEEARRLAHLGFFRRELATDRVTWSDELYAMFGIDPGEAPPSAAAFDAMCTPDSVARRVAAVAQATETGEPWEVELTVRRPSGELRVLRQGGVVERDRDGRITGYHGTVIDITGHRRAEDELHELWSSTSTALDATADSVGLYRTIRDETGRFMDVEPLFINLTGRRRWFEGLPIEELRGQGIFARFPRLRPLIFDLYQQVADTGIAYRGPREFVTPDGTRTIDLAITPYEGGLVHVGRDVTDERRAAAALRDSEARYRAVTDSAADAIITIDATGRIVAVNPSTAHLFGATPGQLVGQPVTQLMPTHDVDGREIVARDFAGDEGHPLTSEPTPLFGRRLDGTEFPVEVSLSSWTLDGRRFVTAFIRDITERRRAEEAVRTADAGVARLAAAIGQTSESVVITGTDGAIQYVNPAFERASGYSAAEAMGQNPRVLQSGVHPRTFYEAMWSELTAGQTWHGELINRRRDGTHYTEVASISPVRDATGATIAYVAVKRDVTAERELEAQVRQGQRLDILGQLAGGVAHDFNNLLAVIRGFGEFVQAALPEGTAERADIDEVLRATDRAAGLTRQLLVFSRRQAVAPQAIRPAEVIADVAAMLRRLLGEHIDLVTRFEPDSGLVLADPGAIEQVVMNLAINARDAMPSGGRLEILTCRVPPSDLLPECVRIEVVDTGCGMDPGTLSRIYEPFFTTKDPGKGTGLGLATVYGIVQACGGWINVTSAVGEGTTFTVDLPIVPSVAEAAIGTGPGLRGGTESILLVEDEQATRTVVRRMLATLGYRVVEAASGAEALEALHGAAVAADLLVTDVRMPGIQGPELARRVRDLRPGLPVLFMSAFTEDLVTDGIGPGHVGFLDKPFGSTAIDHAVREALDAAT